jgi:hypothetical protein
MTAALNVSRGFCPISLRYRTEVFAQSQIGAFQSKSGHLLNQVNPASLLASFLHLKGSSRGDSKTPVAGASLDASEYSLMEKTERAHAAV